MAERASVLDTVEELQALDHPTRLRILGSMREAKSAAGVARDLGEPRQRINHHVKELAKAGLLVPAGERRRGNFVEQLYRARARSFVLSPRLTWTSGERVRALAEQVSLQELFVFGERLQADAVELLDRAAFDGESIPSATVVATVGFADEAARAAFLDEHLRATAKLIETYADADGARYTVGLVVHPTVEKDDE